MEKSEQINSLLHEPPHKKGEGIMLQVLPIISSIIGAVAVVISFAFLQFELKQDAKDKRIEIMERLTKIENKLDVILLDSQNRNR